MGRVTAMLAAFVVAVAAIGAGTGAAILSLKEQVDRWAALETANNAQNIVKVALIADRPTSEVQRAFGIAAREVERLEWYDDRQVLVAATERARAVHENASIESATADHALGVLDEALARLERLIADAENRAQKEAAVSEGQLANTRRDVERHVTSMRALLKTSMMVERIQTRMQAHEVLPEGAGAVLIDDDDLPPPCDDARAAQPEGACAPAATRLRAAVAAYRASPTPEKVAEVAWAAGAFLRRADESYQAIDAALTAVSDSVVLRRVELENLQDRREGLSRLSRMVWDLRRAYSALRDVEDDMLGELDGVVRGSLQNIALRGAALLSPDALKREGIGDADVLVAELAQAWARASAAEQARRVSAESLLDAVSEMDANVSGAADAVRAVAYARANLFAVSGMLILTLTVAAALALAWAVHAKIARPIAAAIAAIMRLAEGDTARRIEVSRRDGAFAPVFMSLENLRLAQQDRLRFERDAADGRVQAERQRLEAEQLHAQLRSERDKIAFHRNIVSIVSHELRTPLAVIDGNAYQIERRAARADFDGVTDKAKSIRRSVARLTDMMETFLMSGALDKGGITYCPEPFDLGELIEDVCALYREAGARQAILTETGEAPRDYAGDARLLRQAIGNLVSNAIKYSPGADRVEVRCIAGEGVIRIAVRDFGYGVPENEIQQIGTQFFRASTANGVVGTGVGLSLVKSLAEIHGGALEIASRVGEGSTFTLALPVEPPARFQPVSDHSEAAPAPEAVSAA